MASEYTPDRWVLVDLITPKETIRKVFCGWFGGYTGADTWKLSSEVTGTTEDERAYHFLNYSGSTYHCDKQAYGMSSYMNSIFSSWMASMTDGMKISVVSEQQPQKQIDKV